MKRRIRVEPLEMRFVAFGDFEVYRSFRAHVSEPRVQCDLEVDVVMEDGEPRCESVRAIRRRGGPPVSGTMLREVPLERLLRYVMPMAARVRVEGDVKVSARGLGSNEEIRDFYAAWRSRKPRGPRAVDDAFLRSVAEVYRAAVAVGDPPTARVAEVLHGSRSSAGRWVMQAREAGFLGPAVDRQPGEVPKRTTRRRR